MRVPGLVIVSAAAIVLAMAPAKTASAQTKLTMGKVIGGDGFHIPTYVALDEDFFKAEGLDASLVELPPSSIVSAVISSNLDCAPIPSGGAQAAPRSCTLSAYRSNRNGPSPHGRTSASRRTSKARRSAWAVPAAPIMTKRRLCCTASFRWMPGGTTR